MQKVEMSRIVNVYCTRSRSAPFRDAGSTIGNDAGDRPLAQLGPGTRQIVKDHTPKFDLRTEEGIART
jgi:hypothetical protein